jgi:hypothetical protein
MAGFNFARVDFVFGYEKECKPRLNLRGWCSIRLTFKEALIAQKNKFLLLPCLTYKLGIFNCLRLIIFFGRLCSFATYRLQICSDFTYTVPSTLAESLLN